MTVRYELVGICCVEGDWWPLLNIIVIVIIICVSIGIGIGIGIGLGIEICVWIDEPIVGIISSILVKIVICVILIVSIVIPVLDNETST